MSKLLILTVVAIGSLQCCVTSSIGTLFTRITSASCVCVGDTLTYECVSVGSGTTEWTGSGFTGCPSENDRILLLHSLFTEDVSGECNSGLILAQGVEVINGTYRSQLNITINLLLNDTSVMCIYTDGLTGTSTAIGHSTIHISGPPETSVINLMDANSTHLTFSVSNPVIHNCSSLVYNVIAFNCGSCPQNTKSTTIICSNFNTSIETNMCNLTVSGVICGNVPGNRGSVLANLKVPNVQEIECNPVYSQEHRLAEINTSFSVSDTFSISNAIDGSATTYTVIYSDSISGESCHPPIIIPASSCVNGICNHLFDVSSLSGCPASANITTTVFASNLLGNGPASNLTTSGVNNFVRINFDSGTMRLICTFLNLPSDDPKQCTANITYGNNCDQQFSDLYTNKSTGKFVTTPPIELISDIAEYCYIVVASSGNVTVAVSGKVSIIIAKSLIDNNTMALVTRATIPSVIILIMVIAIILSVILYYWWFIPIQKFIIKIAIENHIDSHIQILEVFKELNININGYNTYSHHEDFKHHHHDLSEYSVYYVHCTCSKAMESNEDLKARLCRELIPEDLVDESLREKLNGEISIHVSAKNAAGKDNIITIKFLIKDEVGSLLKALKKLKGIESLTLVGINSRHIWELSATGGKHQYSDNDIEFSCSRVQERKVIKMLHMKGRSCAQRVKSVDMRNVKEKPHQQTIEFLVENSPGTLADVLQAFRAKKLNISKINATGRHDTTGSPTRNIRVECCCNDEQRAKLESALNITKHGAEKITFEKNPEGNSYIVTYSVWDEEGALWDSLMAFKEHNINIDAISGPADKACSDVMPPHTGEYHKHIVEFVSTDEKATELTDYITQTNKNVFVRKVQVPHSGHEGTPPCHAN